MITELVNIIKNIALRHKGVRSFRYQDTSLFNSQNNFEPYQVYLDTTQYHQLNITTNIFRVDLNMYIMAQPQQESGKTIAEIQDEAYTIACDILAYLDNKNEYKGFISVHDYSIITFDHYTTNDSAGVRLSIVLAMPSPVSLCNLDDNFNDEPYEPTPDKEIDVPTHEDKEIMIKTIKLPKTSC